MLQKFAQLSALISLVILLAACGVPDAQTSTLSTEGLPEGVSAVIPSKTLTDVTLTGQDSEAVRLATLKGHYTLLAFGYTNCPDVCPLTLAEFKSIKKQLGKDAAVIQFVFVGVDTARDTPERLTQYLSMFDSAFIGLTGDKDSLTKTTDQFGAVFTINDYSGLVKNYTVDHTSSKFLLDNEGRWIRKYAYGLSTAIIAADIQLVMQSSS